MYGIEEGKKAKNIDLGKLEVLTEKQLRKVYSDLIANNLENKIKSSLSHIINNLEVGINYKLRSTSGTAYWNNENIFRIKYHKDLRKNNGKKYKSLIGTAKHECLHLLTKLSDNKEFHKICDKLDIEKHHYNNFDTKENYKYNIYCKGCKKVIAKRKRRSKLIKQIDNYTCSKCGSKLRVEKI